MEKFLKHRTGVWMATIALVAALALAFSLYLHPGLAHQDVTAVTDSLIRESPRALSPESLISTVVETIWKAVFPRS